MMLTGRIIKNKSIVMVHSVEIQNQENSIRDKLEEMLIKLCKELDIQVPIWFERNTREFGAFKKTSFTREQFIEDIKFNKFEIIFEY